MPDLSDLLAYIDPKDFFYILTGMAFMTLTLFPFLKGIRLVSSPIIFILSGALLAISPLHVPFFDVRMDDKAMLLFEHFTEIIVIISLAGAGLALDRKIGFKNWYHTWLLLIFVMPLTIVAVYLAGYYIFGFGMAAALLIAAVLSPTDPVLARSVQVDGPNTGEENDVNVSLTSEAGLNDGLAFPFVYIALAVAGLSLDAMQDSKDWLWHWVGYDLIFRVGMGVLGGWVCGVMLSKITNSKYGDIKNPSQNGGLVLMSCTFLTYGLTELIGGYGFLAVFIAALVGRAYLHDSKGNYAKYPHQFSDQIEKILLSVMLLWLGYYATQTGLRDFEIQELLFAAAIIFLIRPAIGLICLAFSRGSLLDKFAISFLGIRGVGSFYYLAYAQNSYDFADMESIWRVVLLTVMFSIFFHGATAGYIMKKLHDQCIKLQKNKNKAQ